MTAAVLFAASIHAQIVSDGATNTLSNVTNSFTGDVTVGTNGALTLLVLSNNALLTNTLNGTIGRNLTSRSNEVRLISSTARWRMGGNLYVGSNGAVSRLVLSNGALLENSQVMVGNHSASSNNEVLVSGAGSMLNSPNGLFIGADGSTNRLTINNGGQVFANLSGGLTIVGFSEGVRNNSALVTDPGSRWSVNHTLFIGSGGNANTLVVSNSASVDSVNGTIGGGVVSASNNLAIVTGAGSIWTNSNELRIGDLGPGSQLIVSNGGSVLVGGIAYVGVTSFSINNRVTIDGGSLRVTNGTASGVLTLRRGTLTLNSGSLEADQLLVTNAAGFLEFNGGTLALQNSTINNGLDFLIGNGTNAATLLLTGNGTNAMGSGDCLISSNAILAGNGRLVGSLTVLPGGAINPGASVGKISLSVAPTLQGTVNMEISKNGASLTNDQIIVTGTLTYGGSLFVTNGGGALLAAGDKFKLFTASSFLGGFQNLVFPGPLPVGATWTNKLLIDGSIEVVGALPTAQSLSASAIGFTNATLNGLANPRGTNSFAWFEWGATASYGNVTALQALGGGTTNTNFSEILTGLVTNTSYHFRAAASNIFGVVRGTDQNFMTLGVPSAQTLPASEIGTNTAKLNGLANPRGSSSSAWFQWGTTTNYGNVTPLQALGGGTADTDINAVLSGLSTDVLHHFRAAASNSFGVVFGSDRSFIPTFRPKDVTYLKASNTGAGDFFGGSVAVSGGTIVVGASSEASDATGVNGNQNNNFAPGSGAAFVFVRNGTNWTQQAYLKASNTESNDAFGYSVAISDDTIVVGAYGDASNATGVNGNQSNNSAHLAGAAYVFVRNGTNWTQQAYLKASNTDSNAFFGISLAISGDTVVVGADSDASSATGVNGNQTNKSAPNSGAAYVFVRNGTNWAQEAYLKASNTQSNDSFGGSVSISGDTVVVGARGEDSAATGINGSQSDNSAPSSGAAYVFARNGTNWTQQAYLKASNTDSNDLFGSVAISGDTVVVGAIFEASNATGVNGNQNNNSAIQAGAAYVFVRNGTNWTQQAYLKASNAESSDHFGRPAVSGDTLVVGADLEASNAKGINGNQSNNSAGQAGAAYVFRRSGTNWTQQAYLKASNTELDDQFGGSVSVSGSTVVVGAEFEDSNATGINGDQSDNSATVAGAAYIFDLSPPILSITPGGLSQVTLSWTPPTPGFALQESLNLAPASWTNSPSGETNPVTLPATGSTRFFRLFK